MLTLLLAVASAADLDRFVLDTLDHPTTVCNDGSSPVFYFAAAPPGSANADRWLVHFHGNGNPCSTAAECADLADPANGQYTTMGTGCTIDPVLGEVCDQQIGVYAAAGTNPPWEATRSRGGVLSDDPAVNPAFWDWNHVQVISCSSDLWSGDGTTALPVAGFPSIDGLENVHFRGAAIAGEVVATLAMDFGLYEASEVVMTGSGTGAAAVQQHLDRLAWFLPLLGINAEVRGVLDGGPSDLYADMWDDTSSTTGLGCAARISTGNLPDYSWYDAAFVTWDSLVDDSCTPSTAGTYGRCLTLDHVLYADVIDTPFFYRQDLADEEGVETLAAAAPAEPDPAACFTQVMHHRGLNAQRASAMEGFFLPCEGRHPGLAYDDPYAVHLANDHTLAELLDNWVNGSGRVTRAAEPGCLVY